jgi:hypothetical protein
VTLDIDGKEVPVVVEEFRESEKGPAKEIRVRVLKDAPKGAAGVYSDPAAGERTRQARTIRDLEQQVEELQKRLGDRKTEDASKGNTGAADAPFICIYQLGHARGEDVKRVLEAAFGAGKDGGPRGISMLVDSRVNEIIVKAPSAMMKSIEDVIRQLDGKSQREEVFEFRPDNPSLFRLRRRFQQLEQEANTGSRPTDAANDAGREQITELLHKLRRMAAEAEGQKQTLVTEILKSEIAELERRLAEHPEQAARAEAERAEAREKLDDLRERISEAQRTLGENDPTVVALRRQLEVTERFLNEAPDRAERAVGQAEAQRQRAETHEAAAEADKDKKENEGDEEKKEEADEPEEPLSGIRFEGTLSVLRSAWDRTGATLRVAAAGSTAPWNPLW